MSQAAVPTEAVRITIGTEEFFGYPRRFKSGAVGWYLSSKSEIEGERSQISLSIVVIGTKTKTEATLEGKQTAAEAPQEAVKMPPESTNGRKRVKTPPKCSDAV